MDINKENVKSFLFGMLMANQNNIDESVFNREYLVTAKYDNRFVNRDFYKKHVGLERLVYIKTVSSINPEKRNRGNEVASILIGADVESTRINRGNFFDPEVPHFHAFLVISFEEYEKYKNNDENLQSRIRSGLESIRGIKDGSIHIVKYGTHYRGRYYSSINRMFSYVYKGYDQSYYMNIEFPFPSVFPYQLDVDHNNKPDYCNISYRRTENNLNASSKRDNINYALMAHNYDIDALVRGGNNI